MPDQDVGHYVETTEDQARAAKRTFVGHGTNPKPFECVGKADADWYAEAWGDTARWFVWSEDVDAES